MSSSETDRRNRLSYRSDSSEIERISRRSSRVSSSDGQNPIWASCRPPTPTLWQPNEWNLWIARRAALRQKVKEASGRVEDRVIGPVYGRILGSLCDFPEKAARACALNLLKMVLMWGYFTYSKVLNPKQAKSGGDEMVRQLSMIGYPLRDDKEVRLFLKRLRRRMPLSEIMKKTFKRDIALLDATLPIARKLESLGIKSEVYNWLWVEKLAGRGGELPREVLVKSIDEVQAAHAEDFPQEQAEKLKQYMGSEDNDSNNNVVEFLGLNWDSEWRHDAKSLEAERFLLAKFVDDSEYPRWVGSKAYYAFESATAPIKYYNRVVSGLHRCGRLGLYMPDGELARVGGSP